MINITEIRDSFRTTVAQSGIIPTTSIEWENLVFKPEGLPVWLRENWLPANEERDTNKGDYVEGILQFSVFTPIGTSEKLAVETGVAIGNLWGTQELIATDNYEVTVDRTRNSFQGKLDDLWYSYIIDVEIRGYEKH